MFYDYICARCDKTFELNLLMVNREQPLGKPCPNCKKTKCVTRLVNALPIAYMGYIHPAKRAGSGWNDVLKKVAAPWGKHSTVEHY